ncbi:Putative transcriptional regulator [gamma proteobacterium HdN1]|nr:Putative transcriptional regulator [gamma proteobacterium HdN1]
MHSLSGATETPNNHHDGILALDVGNTFTKWFFYSHPLAPACEEKGIECQSRGQFLSAKLDTETLLLLQSELQGKSIQQVLIASVRALNALPKLREALALRGILLTPITTESQRNGLKNSYADHTRLGVDRWLAMLGIWARCHRAFCVVDAGTALTIDFVDENGQHLGGYIIPGIRTMLASLNMATELIGELACSAGSEAELRPGTSTREAVQHGALLSLVGAVEHAIQQAPAIHQTEMISVIGGGDAKLLQRFLGSHWQLRETLVADGLIQYARV